MPKRNDREAAHSLKGSAGNLSATGLFEAARTLERLGAESRLDAAEGAWRVLEAEAANVMDALRHYMPVESRVIPGGAGGMRPGAASTTSAH